MVFNLFNITNFKTQKKFVLIFFSDLYTLKRILEHFEVFLCVYSHSVLVSQTQRICLLPNELSLYTFSKSWARSWNGYIRIRCVCWQLPMSLKSLTGKKNFDLSTRKHIYTDVMSAAPSYIYTFCMYICIERSQTNG